MNKKSQLQILLLGGLLPVIAFTLIEEYYGPVWGTVAGLFFGLGEILFEYFKNHKVSTITWTSNAMIFVLGVISIFTQEGFWFKMQPALLLFAFAFFLLYTSFKQKHFLLILFERQLNQEKNEDRTNQNLNPALAEIRPFLTKLNTRLGLYFFALACLSAYAARAWTTEQWALFKGVGTPALIFLYMIIEFLFFRSQLKRRKS